MGFFSGYRIDLERPAAVRALCSPLLFSADDFDAPEEVDHSKWLRIEDQGQVGSCRGWTRSTNAEISYWCATQGLVTQFSAMWCYLRTQAYDRLLGRDVGSTIENGIRQALEDGHCPEKLFQYPRPARYSTEIPDGAAEAAKAFRSRSSTNIRTPADAHAFLAGLCGGIDFGGPWPLPIRGGVLSNCNSFGPHGHAWSIAGYLEELGPDGKPFFKGINSHAETFGKAGTFKITWSALAQLLRHPNSVAVGISDMTVPKPRPYHFRSEGVI
jgi:hypothetical protein